jgi:hypothetical protein
MRTSSNTGSESASACLLRTSVSSDVGSTGPPRHNRSDRSSTPSTSGRIFASLMGVGWLTMTPIAPWSES